jgi:hypothetical protein
MRAVKIFVGWDSGEPEAYDVCRSSLIRHASTALEIVPIIQQDLRTQSLYSREADPLASTEFTYTRFLVPHLTNFQGWAVFCDCDFLWTRDVADLYACRDDRFAVMCVQHDYQPTESLKILNCNHPATQRLTVDRVNTESGSYLHRFQWAKDTEIGALDPTWNWLEGWNTPKQDGLPGAIHYTRGGPWFENWQDVDYADLWLAEYERVKSSKVG